MKNLMIFILIILPIAVFAQGMPSQQFILYTVWSPDSTALMQIGRGDYVYCYIDTVVLQGTDTDTVLVYLPNPRGYFNLWIIPDTANFCIGGVEHNHILGETDSLSISYKPKFDSTAVTGNPPTCLQFLKDREWIAENAYYETFEPPLCQYLEFYLTHNGITDTSAVILKLLWQ